MQIHGTNAKQIKKGVYFALHGGELRIGKDRYRYNLPAGSVVLPEQNLIFTKTFKGCFSWQYLQPKDFWVITRIGGAETKLTDIDPKNLPDKCMFRMVVAEQLENKVFVFIPSKDGDTVKEWRYFNDFFTGIIRSGDII